MVPIKGVALSIEEAAYLAGLMDGEGSFGIGKHVCKERHSSKRGFVWEIRASIGMTHFPTMEWVKEILKKKRCRVSFSGARKEKGRLPMYYLTMYSGEIKEIVPQILPLLKTKKVQAELILEAARILTRRRDIEVDARIEEMRLMVQKINNPQGRRKYAPRGIEIPLVVEEV